VRDLVLTAHSLAFGFRGLGSRLLRILQLVCSETGPFFSAASPLPLKSADQSDA